MKVLVTGANGYLGRGIVAKLSCYDVEIIATSHHFDKKIDKVIYKDCDLFSIDNPYEYFGHPDILLHLAWKDGFTHMAPSHIENLNLHYMFLKSMIDSGLKHLAVMGSMHEVGFFEGSINENTPCNPLSLYGISKNALRQTMQLLCKDKDIIKQWIRGFYIVGNDPNGASIFSKIAKAAEDKQEKFPFTMGLNQFDFMDYDLFCDSVCKIILQTKINGIINCCSGRPEKLADRVERFIKENNYNIKLEYGAFPDRPYDSKAIWGDSSKLEEILRN